MTGRSLTDAQIATALRAHLPARAQAGLEARVLAEVASTAQQRALPSFFAALNEADPIARRRSLLIAAVLMALAVAGIAAIGSRLLERDRIHELSLEAPADLPAFVLSAYGRMPELPPLAITTLEDGARKGRIYVDETGAVRVERYAALDAPEPETYRIFSGRSIAELAIVGSEKVWIDQEGISEDPRVFVYAALSATFAGPLQPGCEVATSPGEVYANPPGSGWRYVGLEFVVGRPAHHVSCVRDLWIDVETSLVLRSRAPAFDDALQPIAGVFRTIEVIELEFGDQPAALFDLSPPDGVANITPEQECARDPVCSATPPPPFTPPPGATPGVFPPIPPTRATNGWVAYVMQPGISNDGPADIYLAREGSEPHLIVGGNYEHGHNACPSFSPDGSLLAYAEGIDRRSDGAWGQQTVVIIGIDAGGSRVGSEIRIPVAGPGYSGLPCPKWSPDGARVAYQMTGETGSVGLAVTDRQGTSTVVLASDDSEGSVAGPWNANWGEFAWSPAGDVLVATEAAGGLYLVPSDGGEPRLLREGSFRQPVWSPDGSRIAVTTCLGPCERDEVRVLRVDGMTADLELGPVTSPVWSPTGERLAYVATVEVSPGSFASTVFVGDADGANVHPLPYLADPPAEEPWGLASGIRWSPDGRLLLYIGYTSSPTHVYAPVSISASGDAEPVVLAPASMALYAARETDLSWQPVPP
jgi:Tol biopolymer transport system component